MAVVVSEDSFDVDSVVCSVASSELVVAFVLIVDTCDSVTLIVDSVESVMISVELYVEECVLETDASVCELTRILFES